MDPGFFEEVLDVLAGAIPPQLGRMQSSVHRRGLKVWFGEPVREHYESQLLGRDGDLTLEIGFHAEHAKQAQNDAVIARLTASEKRWRKALGDEAINGEFIGRVGWRRISECWTAPDLDDTDAAIEVAARLADYITALEPLRRT